MEFLRPSLSPSSATAPPAPIPFARSLAALILRVGLGLAIVLFHGLPEAELAWHYIWQGDDWPLVDHARSLGVPFAPYVTPAAIALGLAAGCFLVLGILTRFAAAYLVALMVAFSIGLFSPPASPMAEAALAYTSGFAALIVLGSGIFSFDAILSRRPRAPKKKPLA